MTRQEYKKKLEKGIVQFQLPGPTDDDPNPRLLLDGRGIHVGECFTDFFPDGWHDSILVVIWGLTCHGCWFISTSGFRDICPIGLFVKS